MEKRDKLIIAGLVILIIALIAGIFLMGGDKIANSASVPDGMQKFDFNSEFTMAVPENTKFLKEWNNTDEFNIGDGYIYFDRNNEFAVSCFYSPLVGHNLINNIVDMANKSGNATFNVEGELITSHSLVNNGKVGNDLENTEFTDNVIIQKGHQLIIISGNDMELLKSMANTIEFCE